MALVVASHILTDGRDIIERHETNDGAKTERTIAVREGVDPTAALRERFAQDGVTVASEVIVCMDDARGQRFQLTLIGRSEAEVVEKFPVAFDDLRLFKQPKQIRAR